MCADATFTLKTALQTLREHDQNHGYYLSISLKLTIQSTEKCYGRSSQLLEYQKAESEVLKSCTRITILRVGEKLEQFLSTSGVKQGDISTRPLYLCHPRSIQHSRQEMGFHNPTLDGFRTLKLEASREDNYAEPITPTRAQCSRSSYICRYTAILLSRGEVIASKLIVSHFRRFGLTIHTGSKRKGETRKRRPFTFRGLDRNHRLLIWRTSKSTPTALCPSSSNT
jgi:hypothetical protein